MIIGNAITFSIYVIDPIDDQDFKNSVLDLSKQPYELFSNYLTYFPKIKACIVHNKYTLIRDNNKWITIEIPSRFFTKQPYELFSILTKASHDVLIKLKSKKSIENNCIEYSIDKDCVIATFNNEIFLRDTISIDYISTIKFNEEVRESNKNI